MQSYKLCHSQWKDRVDPCNAGCPDRVLGPRVCHTVGYNTPFVVLDLQTVACMLLLAARLEKAVNTQA